MHTSDIHNFNQIYRLYRQRFIHFAKTYVNDPDVAEDIVMDSLMYYWENRRSLKSDLHLPAYLLTVIKHKCLNHLQHEKTRAEVEKYLLQQEDWARNLRMATLEACDPEKVFSDEIRQIIDTTLSTLSKHSREIYIRSKYENQSNKEIAAALNLSVKSIEYHMTKMLKILRIALKDYFPQVIFIILPYAFRVFAYSFAIL